jgi:hypothetical protein
MSSAVHKGSVTPIKYSAVKPLKHTKSSASSKFDPEPNDTPASYQKKLLQQFDSAEDIFSIKKVPHVVVRELIAVCTREIKSRGTAKQFFFFFFFFFLRNHSI